MMINRLIFEGPDDRHVVMNLLFNHDHQGHSLCDLFDAKVKDGVETLIRTLNEEIGATDVRCLGIILDADVDLARQWARVTRVLDGCGCKNVPAAPRPGGTLLETGDGKCIGVWVMPDNAHDGALEDFVGALIDKQDDLWPKAKSDVDAIPKDRRRFRETYISKAQVHTWLAWQEEPGTRMGGAFRKKYLDPDHPLALIFVDWIKQLLSWRPGDADV